MQFFHAILCNGTPRSHLTVAHCARADTELGARKNAEIYIRAERARDPHQDLFLRVFRVTDGVGTEITND